MKDALRRWQALWNPEQYHGWGRSRNYFEGWYFKLIDPSERYALAVIPGISMDKTGKQEAFIQVLDGKQCKAAFHSFPAAAFVPTEGTFEVQLGGNYFSGSRLALQLPGLEGVLHFSSQHPWPSRLGAPGIMGWYSFMPFMECYHGVVSVFHQLSGQLSIEGKPVDFTGGIGYMEKDWGRSFPSSWIWMQSNHFDHPEPVSVMVSVARIPWLGSHFVGFIAGFLWEGKIYRMATYTGARLQAAVVDGHPTVVLTDNRYRLEVTGLRAEGADLISPISGRMTGKVNESLLSQLSLSFYDGNRLLFAGIGRNAGLELAGRVEEELINA